MTDLTSDREVLAATIWGEARGEILSGKRAVAAVIVNRVKASAGRRQFGDGTIRGACLAPWQFSCWNEAAADESQRAALLALDFSKDDPVIAACGAIADEAISGTLVDPTDGCTFYKTTKLPWPKAWGREIPACAIVGHQSFYKLP
ncbi:MAG: cell wall hydrolase [Rhizomicrobium sp.]